MRTVNFFQIFILAVLVSLFSCKNKNANTVNDGKKAETTLAKPDKGKYALKSAIVEYKVNVMNMEQKQTITFDDYGAKETTIAQMEMIGVKINQYTIIKDGYIYSFDLKKKTGTKAPMVSKADNIDFQNLTEEIKEEMKIKKVGEETFFGKPCVKYFIDNGKLKMNGNYLVWRVIALKTDIDMGGMKMQMEAIKVEENPSIPANTFDVPVDIKFNKLIF